MRQAKDPKLMKIISILNHIRMRLTVLSILLASLAAAQTLVIKHVALIDATGKAAQPEMTVVIAGDSRRVRSPI